MSVIRYFGRFNPLLNTAVPDPDTDANEEISEKEARLRFDRTSFNFDVIPSVDPATGFIPWCVEYKPNYPHMGWFHAEIIGPEGLATHLLVWEAVDENRQLLLHRIERYDYSQEWGGPGTRNNGDWDFRVMLSMFQDGGPADIRFDEQVDGRFADVHTTGQVETPLLTRPMISFGQWEELFEVNSMDEELWGVLQEWKVQES